MQAFTIDVAKIEELQTLKDIRQLEQIFTKAKSTVVNGEKVILVRKATTGTAEKFDEISTEQELDTFRRRVFLYLGDGP